MPWTLRSSHLDIVLTALSISAPNNFEKIFFFGVRGALPAGEPTRDFSGVLDGSKPVNYQNMRCTIGQWWPQSDYMALYKGSTVPTLKYVEAAADNDGHGTNLLLPGLYTEPDSDLVETDTPCDNLHAAWGDDAFSSAGCQVVSGRPGKSPWKTFKERGYDEKLSQYRYLMMPSSSWVHLATTGEPAIVIGSRGDRAKAVQEALLERGLLTGSADGQFGPRSGLALVEFQRQRPELPASVICTATVAGMLGIKDW